MKTCILTLLIACAAARTACAATTILGTARSLQAYSSGYQYRDPNWNEFEHPPMTPWPLITILPDNRTESSSPGIGASTHTLSSFNQYVGSGTAGATANIGPETIIVALNVRAGNPVGGSPPGPDVNPGSWFASARASFEVDFSLDTATRFDISGVTYFGYSYSNTEFPVVIIQNESGQEFFRLTYSPGNAGGGAYTSSGILPAGTYSFEVTSRAGPVHPEEPFFPNITNNFTLTLTPLPVPEPGTCALTVAVLGCGVVRRRRMRTRARSKKEGVAHPITARRRAGCYPRGSSRWVRGYWRGRRRSM